MGTSDNPQPDARDLAGQVGEGLGPFKPGRLTKKAAWFSDPGESRVVVVVGADRSAKAMDEVLAYALAWQGDKDLALIVPDGHQQQTLNRLAWIDSPVRVFVYGPEWMVRPAVIPARAEVLDSARSLRVRPIGEGELGDVRLIVEPLVTWADDQWSLTPAHRRGYLAWHYRGRQVLKLSRAKGGVKITAGVDYRKPPAGQGEALELIVSPVQPLTRAVLDQIQARVRRAIINRRTGVDSGHAEHRLQEALDSGLLGEALELEAVHREYPAWRGKGQPGFVDFLGFGRDHRLHVIETKMNPGDVGVVLQSLDYAIWVMANAEDIRAERRRAGTSGAERVVVDFVCAPRARGQVAIGRYMAAQLEVLSPEITWRIWLIPDPKANPLELTPAPPRTMPTGPLVAEPVVPFRWKGRVQRILRDGGAPTQHPTAELAFLPAALPVLADLTRREAPTAGS